MAKALTGNPDSDTANLKTLQTMFAGGIKQNQQNAKDVSYPAFSALHKLFCSVL